jgi:hypothetical protein
MKLPQIFALHPDTRAAEDLLHRIHRTHFGQRLRVVVKAGIPLMPRRKGRPDTLLGQIPAVGYHPGQQAVLLHPAVLHRKPPRFVLRYLIHHALVDARREQQGHGNGCHHALCPILAYGNRVNRWLIDEGFPPLHESGPEEPASSRLPPPQTMPRVANSDMMSWRYDALTPILMDHEERDDQAPCVREATKDTGSNPLRGHAQANTKEEAGQGGGPDQTGNIATAGAAGNDSKTRADGPGGIDREVLADRIDGTPETTDRGGVSDRIDGHCPLPGDSCEADAAAGEKP